MGNVQYSSAYVDKIQQSQNRHQRSVMIAQQHFDDVKQNDGIIPEDVIDLYGETTILNHINRPEYANRNLVSEVNFFRESYVANFGFTAITKQFLSALVRYTGNRKCYQ